MTTSRRLVVMRHSKAEPYATTDRVRTLTDRGRRDAADAGAFLASVAVVPDHALVSSAARTVGTWEAVTEAAGSDVEPVLSDDLYDGGPDVVLESIRAVPETARTVIVIGHNPTIAALAHMLDDGEGDPAAMNEMASGYPTSALAVFEVDDPWSKLSAEQGRLTHFHVGRR